MSRKTNRIASRKVNRKANRNSKGKAVPAAVLGQCRIEGITHNGEGVGRIDGQAVFVPGAIPGEKVSLEFRSGSRSFIRAALIDILEASPHRAEPECPYYESCGGCSYQHMDYETELECKRQVVEQQLRRIGGQQCAVQPVIGMEQPWAYRNKVEWQLFTDDSRTVSLGYVNPAAGGPVPISGCRLLKPEINRLSMALHRSAGLLYGAGVRRIGVRWSDGEQSLMLNLFSSDADVEADRGEASTALLPRVKEIIEGTPGLEGAASVNLVAAEGSHIVKGPGYIMENLAGLRFRISPRSFFQVNRVQAERLLEILDQMAAVQGGEHIVDAYCGTGIMALSLAARAARANCAVRVTGVENHPGAVWDARENARLNKISNCRFIEGACEDILPALPEDCDVLVLDPPRAGCKPPVLQAALQLRPARIIYVSCNPGTLARDLKILAGGGYAVHTVQPIDMFPRTWHVESIVLLQRQNTVKKRVYKVANENIN